VKSRLYTGTLRHRRHLPREHAFRYQVFMPYLHLGELDEVLSQSPLWSRRRWAPARFRRADFLGDPPVPLDTAVRERIHEVTGEIQRGPIYLLANLRYFGYQMNPLACYYCFREDGATLQYLVANVTNTPWKESHSYVLPAQPEQRILRHSFAKTFHVSPFNPMDMHYEWRSNLPGERLAIHLENHSQRGREFDATLALEAQPLNASAMHRVLWQFPLMTGKVAAAIYFEALKLFIKRVPLYPHPGTTSTTGANQ
jgi:DUF1365 family protein